VTHRHVVHTGVGDTFTRRYIEYVCEAHGRRYLHQPVRRDKVTGFVWMTRSVAYRFRRLR